MVNNIGYFFSAVGILLAILWVVQTFTPFHLLSNAATGAAVCLLVGFGIQIVSRNKAGK